MKYNSANKITFNKKNILNTDNMVNFVQKIN